MLRSEGLLERLLRQHHLPTTVSSPFDRSLSTHDSTTDPTRTLALVEQRFELAEEHYLNLMQVSRQLASRLQVVGWVWCVCVGERLSWCLNSCVCVCVCVCVCYCVYVYVCACL
jgi:hypothetical protein